MLYFDTSCNLSWIILFIVKEVTVISVSEDEEGVAEGVAVAAEQTSSRPNLQLQPRTAEPADHCDQRPLSDDRQRQILSCMGLSCSDAQLKPNGRRNKHAANSLVSFTRCRFALPCHVAAAWLMSHFNYFLGDLDRNRGPGRRGGRRSDWDGRVAKPK